jgi:very-short-patch-repair endonuclease
MSTAKAKELRKNSTDAERALWRQLRAHRLIGYKFRRQQPMGRYIVDFVCFEKQVIVELDGGQHAEQAAYDAERTAWLQSQGFRVLRFWNQEVLQNTEAMVEVILRECERKAPSL